MDSDSAASEYRLDIKGISVFCPCGEFLWLYDDGSRFKLSRHLKKCKKYKNKQGLPLTNIVNQSLMSIKVEKGFATFYQRYNGITPSPTRRQL